MIRPLKIAFFATVDKQSGTYFRYHNLAKGLTLRGHQVTVYSQRLSKGIHSISEDREGVEYVLQPSCPGDRYVEFALNPGNILARYATYRRERHSRSFDVYHLFQPFENAAWQWQWYRRHFIRHPPAGERPLFVFDWDDLWYGGLLRVETMGLFKKLRYRYLRHMEHELPGTADLVTTCSSYLAVLARERSASRVEIIHNGIWADDQESDRSVTGRNPASLRQSFQLDPAALYLGFVGWTSAESEWCLDVLEALGTQDTLGRPVRLACAGYDLREHLGDRRSDLFHRIDYLGNLPPAQAQRLMQALDVGLLPLADTSFNRSRLPIKFAEYLAAGLPVLCGDVGEVGRLGRQLRGVVLLPPDREGWSAGCVRTIREMLLHGTTVHPDRDQLVGTLGWPILAGCLEASYQALSTPVQ